MIKTGFRYKVYRPKNVSGNKTVFDVGHKDKEGNMHYLTIMCDQIDLQDKEEIKIVEINGMDQKFWTDKNGVKKEQTTLFCKVEKEHKEVDMNIYYPETDLDGKNDGKDDLPF